MASSLYKTVPVFCDCAVTWHFYDTSCKDFLYEDGDGELHRLERQTLTLRGQLITYYGSATREELRALAAKHPKPFARWRRGWEKPE